MPELLLKAEDLPNDPDKLVQLYKEQMDIFNFFSEQCERIEREVGPFSDPETGEEISILSMDEKQLPEAEELARDAIVSLMTEQHTIWRNLKLIRMDAMIREIPLPLVDKAVPIKLEEREEKKKETKPSKKPGRPLDKDAERRRELIFKELNVDSKKEAAKLLSRTDVRHKIYSLLDKEGVPFLKSNRYESKCWKDVSKNLDDDWVKETLIRDMRKNWDRLKTLHKAD